MRVSFTLDPERYEKLLGLTNNGYWTASEAMDYAIDAIAGDALVRPLKQIGYPVPKGTLSEICRAHHVRKLSIFGSALTNRFRDESDLDLLVEFKKGVSFFDLAALEEALAPLFKGRKVDLRTPGELSRIFRDEVLKKAVVIYDDSD
ncbi:MAG: nucleotidyltransferase family protein [Bdellovibrionota bacterium]